jgi:uncharacterized protein YyaL (SSP411 family)
MARLGLHIAFAALVSLSGVLATCGDAPPARGAANRLAKESSPYLLQHAHNPVDWYPWGREALDKAKKENKLIFLSIGYSACHWCHVMERETFSNLEIAKILNDSFVCIKVDREERPDIDQVFMTALQCCRVPGGWPLSMFLTPDAKPITGGTYWPPDDKEINGQTMRGFKGVLKLILDLEKYKPKELRERGEQIADLTRLNLGRISAAIVVVEPDRRLVNSAVEALEASFDSTYGGFGNAEKSFRGPNFPTPPSLELLWQVDDRQPEHRQRVLKTLTTMARGGIYDQLGGGFHRYSTERTWMVPHFEKMLYDNAQLAELYSRAFAATKDPLYRRIVEETLEFVGRDLTAPGGAFYSALDADSDGEEGKSYVWTTDEIAAALPSTDEQKLARRAFGCDGAPNFEGRAFVLSRPDRGPESADPIGIVQRKLLAARDRRAKPFLDTKILTSWNGEMIAGFAEAGRHLGNTKFVDAASKAAEFVFTKLRGGDGRLYRMYAAAPGQTPEARGAAYLDDYAFLVHGLLALHDATKSDRWLSEAKTLTDAMIRDFGDTKAGGFFYTAADHETLFVRTKDQFDGAQPSGNSVAVRNLLRLAEKTGDARYRNLAEKALRSFAPSLEQNPAGLSAMAAVLDTFLVQAPLLPQAPGGGSKPTNSDSVVKVTGKSQKPGADGKQVIKLTLAIDKGWHVYANPIGNEDLASAQTVVKISGGDKAKTAIDYPKGKTVKDKIVGDYNVYETEAVIGVTVEWPKGVTPAPLELSVKLQACNEKTCLLPATIKVSIP